ncbi:unnamed protein product [Dracunculus medinensis]|uniref:Ovule protein n=1 Tax=Dracunculus medinensis TaxID=318479 RepID=A0A0N4UE33_DRAME|nr:unnamed protein product [Dracunculus medinensis]
MEKTQRADVKLMTTNASSINNLLSDQTTTSATSSQTCKFLYKHKEINAVIKKQIASDIWTTNNNIQYSYGWLGVRLHQILHSLKDNY